jgi:hypothetical protein
MCYGACFSEQRGHSNRRINSLFFGADTLAVYAEFSVRRLMMHKTYFKALFIRRALWEPLTLVDWMGWLNNFRTPRILQPVLFNRILFSIVNEYFTKIVSSLGGTKFGGE